MSDAWASLLLDAIAELQAFADSQQHATTHLGDLAWRFWLDEVFGSTDPRLPEWSRS